MRKFIFFVFFIALFFLAQGNYDQAHAARFASCDQCGFCITPSIGTNPPEPGKKPGNWESCRNCLYPALTDAPYPTLKTMEIPETADANGLPINIPPTTQPGHYYTAVGCLTTNVGDFTGQGAAAGVVTPILNIMFSLAGGIAFLYLMYGAFLILTSRGDFEQLSQGKRTVYGSIVGLIFTLTSVFVINLLANGVLKIPGFGGN